MRESQGQRVVAWVGNGCPLGGKPIGCRWWSGALQRAKNAGLIDYDHCVKTWFLRTNFNEPRKLRPSGKPATSLAEAVDITLRTHCPAKWAFVDMETGELWGHDGAAFRRLLPAEAADVAAVAKQAA